LRAYKQRYAGVERQRLGRGINANDTAMREVLRPHRQRRASNRSVVVASNSDLKQPYRLVAQMREQLVIDGGVEMRAPLVRAVLDGESCQRVYLIVLGYVHAGHVRTSIPDASLPCRHRRLRPSLCA